MKKIFSIITILVLCWSCDEPYKETVNVTFSNSYIAQYQLTENQLYNKILGMLVGSAIGDAMGAPTEMWSREKIFDTYGFVQNLDSMARMSSPEGVWKDSLPAGGTTDDTRWKVLISRFLESQDSSHLSPRDFAKFIQDTYQSSTRELESIQSRNPKDYIPTLLKMGWLAEWSEVSTAFLSGNLEFYGSSLGKFYGGEMVCAGLLYAPSIGSYFPGKPKKAYEEAFKLSLYDIGYAKDLTAMASAMTSAAMNPEASIEDLKTALLIDPKDYKDSRLVGRLALSWVNEAERISLESRGLDSVNSRFSPLSAELSYAYEQLDMKQQDMPFHAGEIFLQTLTAMYYSDFQFLETLIFLTNYGRDNDTTAALAGGILGAYYGFDSLPEKEKEQVLSVAKFYLNQDLEKAAKNLVSHMLEK